MEQPHRAPSGRAEQSILVRIARDELRRLRELTHTINSLEHDIADLIAQIAPQLLNEPGVGRLTAAGRRREEAAMVAALVQTPSAAWRPGFPKERLADPARCPLTDGRADTI